MSRKTEEQFSKAFIVFTFLFLFVFTYILVKQNENGEIKDITAGELVEYSDYEPHPSKKQKQEENSSILKNINNFITETKNNKQKEIFSKQKINPEEEYRYLLDEIGYTPIKSAYSTRIAINKLLVHKGYPKDIIKINPININQTRANVEGTAIVANFDITNGTLNIDEEALLKLDSKLLISILVHELDHFDKIASICRYMGIDNFVQLLNQNNIYNINTPFWRIASSFAQTTNFNGEYYKEALKRFINLNKLEEKGIYQEFYRIAEEIRNPLEISAYSESDFVCSHYGIVLPEGPTQKLTEKFNNIDWAIYNYLSRDTIVEKERIALFDYLFMLAVLEQFPDMRSIYDSCINYKDGNMYLFWRVFKNSKINNFSNSKTQINQKDLNQLMSLLNSVENKMNNITPNDVIKALEMKINTLKKEKLNSTSITELQETIESYIDYANKNNITNKQQELNNTITLICIKNKLYTNNVDINFSLHTVEMPDILVKLNNISHRKQRFLPIYNNPKFKENRPNNITEEQYLVNLIDKNRLNMN